MCSICYLIPLVFSAGTTAGPTVHIGAGAAASLGSVNVTYYDRSGDPIAVIAEADMFAGPDIAAELRWGPAQLRMTLAQYRLLFEGGSGFLLFPKVGAEVSLFPPFRWRVLPVVTSAVRLNSYSGVRAPDVRAGAPLDYHIGLGPGVRVRLNDRMDLSLDVLLWETRSFADYEQYVLMRVTATSFGINSARLGFSYSLSPP